MSVTPPAIPSDLHVSRILYDASFAEGESGDYARTFTVEQGLQATLTFASAQAYVDLTEFETSFTSAVTALCQAQADITGQALTDIQSAVQITRRWEFDNGTQWGASLSFDPVPYPPAS